MPTYVGFSSINAEKPRTVNEVPGLDGRGGIIQNPLVYGKRYRLTDAELVIQDLVNALNIRKGEKVGQPSYGTTLWDFIFEPNTADVQTALKDELRRVCALDPRIQVNTVRSCQREEGILVEVQLSINPFNNAGDIACSSLITDTNSATLSF